MDKYKVKISPRAIRELDSIYAYIANDKLAPENARGQVERIKKAILNLDTLPQSHQERSEGRYAEKGYRQLLMDHYIAIFRIDEVGKTVYVITIQYQGRNLWDKYQRKRRKGGKSMWRKLRIQYKNGVQSIFAHAE